MESLSVLVAKVSLSVKVSEIIVVQKVMLHDDVRVKIRGNRITR